MKPVKFKTNPAMFRDVMFPRNFMNVFEDFFGNDAVVNEGVFFKPGVDIVETDNAFQILISLPGMNKEDIKVEMKGEDLVVSGERTARHTEDKGKVHVSEINYGKFSRSFFLPDNVVKEKIDAAYADGILTLNLPKGEASLAKTISIK